MAPRDYPAEIRAELVREFGDIEREENNSPRLLAAKGLFARIRSGRHGYAGSNMEGMGQRLLTDPYFASLMQAVHEMIATSTEAGFDEEHHTSSLMGHWATAACWWNFLHSWSEEIDEVEVNPKAEVFWAQQSKKVEGFSGGDFGVARRIDNQRFAIALFQAKCLPLGTNANVWRVRSDKKAQADQALWDVKVGDATLTIPVNRDAPEAMETKLHQLQKLMRWNQLGRDITGKNKNWCHYVFWSTFPGDVPPHPEPSLSEPLMIPVSHVWKNIISGISKIDDIITDKFDLSGVDFYDFVYTVSANNPEFPGFLVVNNSDAAHLIGRLAESGNLPVLLATDGTGGGGGAAFFQHALGSHYKVTRQSGPSFDRPPPAPGRSGPAGPAPAPASSGRSQGRGMSRTPGGYDYDM